MTDRTQSRRSRIDWVAVGALALLTAFLQPALRVGFRADDTWNSVVKGELMLSEKSLPSHLWDTAEHFFTSTGRPNGLGPAVGLALAWLVDDQAFLYHALIVALTVAAAGALYKLARELGLSRAGCLLLVTLIAGAVQFRSYHDPLLGYSGMVQILLILTLVSLLLFVRGLRDGDRRLLVGSFMIFLPCPLLYEGAYTLVALYPGVALLERRGWAALRPTIPFLALSAVFVVLSLIGRMRATGIEGSGYEVGSSPLAAVKTYLIQLLTPLPGSNLAFGTDFASFLPLGGDPTAAELLAGGWRGLAVFMVVVGVCWHLSRDGGKALPGRHVLWALATVGTLLWLTSALAVSFAPKYQFELRPGNGHLPALIQVFGWGLLATACLLALLRAAAGRSAAAVASVTAGAALALGFAAGAVGYANLRVVALETPIVETRSLLEEATADGIFGHLPERSSLLFTMRDLGWQTGNWTQVPTALEAMLVARDARRFDGRVANPTLVLDCARTASFPPAECEPLARVAAWVRVRAHPNGGSVIVARIPSVRAFAPEVAPAYAIRAYVRADDPRPPRLIGEGYDGGRWRSSSLRWREVAKGDGWAIYETMPRAGRLPVASTIDDRAGMIDFTALGPPERIVRIYGTKRLLP